MRSSSLMNRLAEYIKKEQKGSSNLGKYWYKNVVIEVSSPTKYSVKLCLDKTFSRFYSVQIAKYIREIEVVESSVIAGNNAFFKDHKIYISSSLSEEQFVNSLIHEISHGLIKTNKKFFFDDLVLSEFIRKRKMLLYYLKAYKYDVDEMMFYNLINSDQLKDYLEKKVGYGKLVHFAAGLFPSINSITSPAEYVAEAFEMALTDDPRYIASISPEAFKKVKKFIGK